MIIKFWDIKQNLSYINCVLLSQRNRLAVNKKYRISIDLEVNKHNSKSIPTNLKIYTKWEHFKKTQFINTSSKIYRKPEQSNIYSTNYKISTKKTKPKCFPQGIPLTFRKKLFNSCINSSRQKKEGAFINLFWNFSRIWI